MCWAESTDLKVCSGEIEEEREPVNFEDQNFLIRGQEHTLIHPWSLLEQEDRFREKARERMGLMLNDFRVRSSLFAHGFQG